MPNQTGPGDGPPSPDPPVPPPSDLKPPGRKLTPHDSIFRRIFGMTGNAASQLRSVLPPDVATRLDLSRLVPAPGSFVDEALKWKHADLLFTVSTMDGQDAFVYVLMEHQSTDDPLMAFRVLRYVTRIWDRYLEEHPRARRLPAVIPFVVHNGRGRWTSPVQLPDLIDLGPADKKAMETYLPRFGFLLDDLADIDLWQLRDRELTPLARITLVLLKTAPGNRRIRTELSDPAASLGPDAETY